MADKWKKIFIAGLPNTGKSLVFGNLTGKYALVANYPSTTVHAQTAGFTHNAIGYQVTDTPGFHSLYIHSEEERMLREMIISEKPDIIIQCIDANQLKQSLHLTAGLLELGIPLVISLNDIDVTTRQGKSIAAVHLAHLLGIPVIETVATEGRGTAELKKALESAGIGISRPVYPHQVEQAIEAVTALLPKTIAYRRLAATLILQNDPFVLTADSWLPASLDKNMIRNTAREWKARITTSFQKAINSSTGKWVDMVEKQVMSSPGTGNSQWLAEAARISRHPVLGFPILLLVLVACYFVVVNAAGAIERFLAWVLFDPATAFLAILLPDGFWQDMVLGNYGILTMGLFSAIGTVLPVLSVFFLLFGLLEDVGYLPNAGILIQRILAKIGLSGKAMMPLILGFGCKTMATLTTRSIPSRKERLIAMYLIAFAIPCSAQLGLNMAILGKTGIISFIIANAFLLIVELLAGLIMNRLIKDDRKSSFIQELPVFRVPHWKSLFKKTAYRLLWFLKESLVVFIIAAAALYLIDLTGALHAVKNFMAPVVVHWLGLPLEMVEALLLTMVRGELAAGYILKLASAGGLNYIQSITAVVTTTMFVPCLATIVAMFKEAGIRAGISMVLAINVSTFILAGILHWILILTMGG